MSDSEEIKFDAEKMMARIRFDNITNVLANFVSEELEENDGKCHYQGFQTFQSENGETMHFRYTIEGVIDENGDAKKEQELIQQFPEEYKSGKRKTRAQQVFEEKDKERNNV